MSTELVPINPVFRRNIPEEHKANLDTRLLWLWNQRFGTLQSVWRDADDVFDKTAASILMQCIIQKDLDSIVLLFKRLEGGAVTDEENETRRQERENL